YSIVLDYDLRADLFTFTGSDQDELEFVRVQEIIDDSKADRIWKAENRIGFDGGVVFDYNISNSVGSFFKLGYAVSWMTPNSNYQFSGFELATGVTF
ncbi:MAG: hypothetical protein AAFN65_12965, partial [Bacteroidota bacterium]